MEELDSELNRYLNANRQLHGGPSGYSFNKRVYCNDGYSISIQCGAYLHSEPQTPFKSVDEYTSFELGLPNQGDVLINEYAENPLDYTDTMYPYIKRDIVEELIKKHGGIKNE